jgi:hypothetical protein
MKEGVCNTPLPFTGYYLTSYDSMSLISTALNTSPMELKKIFYFSMLQTCRPDGAVTIMNYQKQIVNCQLSIALCPLPSAPTQPAPVGSDSENFQGPR